MNKFTINETASEHKKFIFNLTTVKENVYHVYLYPLEHGIRQTNLKK